MNEGASAANAGPATSAMQIAIVSIIFIRSSSQ
jgi:hypothetical protein